MLRKNCTNGLQNVYMPRTIEFNICNWDGTRKRKESKPECVELWIDASPNVNENKRYR